MASQPGKQAISMKFGDLIECNTKKTSLEKSHRKWGSDTIPRFFSEVSKLSVSLTQ